MSFTFWLADGTGELPVTVWNRKCEELYLSLCRADMVHVSGYALRMWRTGPADGQAEWRASVNTRNPTGEVRLLLDDAIVDAWGEDESARRLPTPPPPQSQSRVALRRALEMVMEPADEAASAGWSGGAGTADIESSVPASGGLLSFVSWETDRAQLFDLACVVLRAYAPFRLRRESRHRAARFVRARWLTIILSDGGDPLPLLLYADHLPMRRDTVRLFPDDEQAVGPSQTQLQVGKPLLLRNVAVADGGPQGTGCAVQQGGAAGSSAEHARVAAAADAGAADAERLVVVRSAVGTYALAPDERGELSGGLDCDGLQQMISFWRTSPRGRQQWAAGCRVENGPAMRRSPASLSLVLGGRLPPLSALCAPSTIVFRRQLPVGELPSLLASLHTQELRSILVKATLAPPVTLPPPAAAARPSPDGAAATTQTAAAADFTAVPGANGTVLLSASVAAINGGSPRIAATLRLNDGTDKLSSPDLWQTLLAASGARARSGGPTTACTEPAVLAAAVAMQGRVLALALDVYKPGPAQPCVEVVGLYLLQATSQPQQKQPPPPQQPLPPQQPPPPPQQLRSQSAAATAAAARRRPEAAPASGPEEPAAQAAVAAAARQEGMRWAAVEPAATERPGVRASPAITRRAAASMALPEQEDEAEFASSAPAVMVGGDQLLRSQQTRATRTRQAR